MKSTRTVFSTPGGRVGKGVGVREGAGVNVGRRVGVCVGGISWVGVELSVAVVWIVAVEITAGLGAWVQLDKQIHTIRTRVDRVRCFMSFFSLVGCDGLLPGAV
jgi:hypothetical protein